MGSKRAIVAIAHHIIKAVFHIIKHGEEFKDLGDDCLANRYQKSTLAYLNRKARQLGYKLVRLPDDAGKPPHPLSSETQQTQPPPPIFPELAATP
ncbi:hypothetical protein ACFL2Q_06495 [Thermodesulfobacteriota bacterium]